MAHPIYGCYRIKERANTNSASCKSVDELLKFNPEMELALTLTRFLMHLYLKKLILEVPNTMFEGVMDRAAIFYNYMIIGTFKLGVT